MTKHYEADQREIRRTLNEPLAPTRTGSSRPPPSKEYLPEFPRDGTLPQIEGVPSLLSSLIPPTIVAEREPPRKKLRVIVATGMGIAVALVAGVLLVKQSTSSGEQPAAPVVPPAPHKPPDAIAQVARQPSAETVWLTLSSVPDDAEIRLDGRRISNPYRAVHRRDAVPHHITVSLDGYQTLEREIMLTTDAVLRFSLEVAAHDGPHSSKRQNAPVRPVEVAPPSGATAAPTPIASHAPAAGAPKPGEQKPVTSKPGDDLRRLDSRAHKALEIDEMDPYKR